MREVDKEGAVMAKVTRRINGRLNTVASGATKVKVALGNQAIDVHERSVNDKRHVIAKMLV